MKRTLTALVLVLTLLILTTLSTAAVDVQALPAYDVTLIGNGFPTAINDGGQIAGWATEGGFQRAWVYSPDSGRSLLPLPPDATHSQAADINNAGVIVGWVSTSAYVPNQAVAWTPGPTGYEIAVLASPPDFTHSAATAINDLGDIVGYAQAPGFLGSFAALFTDPGGVLNLAQVGFAATPADLNNARQVVGSDLRLDLDTLVVEDLGVPPGSFLWSVGYAINNAGQVTGYGQVATGLDDDQRVIRYTDGIGWEVLSSVGPYNAGYAIADNGDVLMEIATYCASGGGRSIVPALFIDELNATYCLRDLLGEAARDWIMMNSFLGAMSNTGHIAGIASNPVTNQSGTVLLTPAGTLPPPAAPSDLTAVPHPPTWQQPWNAITLSWTNNSRLTIANQIERRVAGTDTWALLTTVGATAQSYWDMDVALGETYDYRVQAVGLGGNSPYSNVATATAPADPVDNIPPTVTIVAPADGAQVSGNVTIVVEASDNIGLTFMDIQASGNYYNQTVCSQSLGGQPTFTLTCNWNTNQLEPSLYSVHAYAGDAMNNGSYATITVQVGNTGDPTLVSSDISLRAKLRQGVVTVTGNVTVQDQEGNKVRSAMVYATWTLPDGSSQSYVAYTNRRGIARFEITGPRGTYTLTVTDLVKAGYTFDPDGSVLSASITR